MTRLIAIDPGNSKCGLLLVDKELGIVIEGKVVKNTSVIDLINTWDKESSIDLIVLGNGTTSLYWKSEIKKKTSIPIKLFEEKNTTLRARNRYWELWPKNFFLRFLPKGMILPAENLDAIAALVLMEDYLDLKLNWPKKVSFKIWP